MRNIKDAKDLSTNELIYFKGHAKATYMSDGTTVEDAINNIEITGGVGDLNVQSDWNETDTTSDAYIKNKPTIPSTITESTVSGWGFTKNTGTYSKPSGGIPKTDLASAVQTSLGKADTALQSYTEQYKGTVTGVKVNGSTKSPSSGIVDLGTVITSHQDISGKQDKLVSGTNIKTINGTSILGSGNIVIEGGGSSSGGSGAYPVEYHGAQSIGVITPNVFHIFEEPAIVDFIFGDEQVGVVNEYILQISFIEHVVPASFPDTIQWANGEPIFERGKTYQISIVNNIGLIVSV